MTAEIVASLRNLLDGMGLAIRSRKPSIMDDTAHAILTKNSRECTGNFFVDDDLLKAEGVTDLSQYSVDPKQTLQEDFFV